MPRDLNEVFPPSEARANRDEVLAQGFWFKPRWWRDRVPQFWPEQLDALPEHPSRTEYRFIMRADVFGISQSDPSPTGLAKTLVAAYVWGTGKWGFLVGRRARSLTHSDPDEIKSKLSHAFDEIVSNGGAAAYRSMARPGEANIPYLGPSFFTKFLYFVGWNRSADTIQPLILDRFVALALNEIDESAWTEVGPWTHDQYQRYVEAAHGLETWAPDAVEMRLFNKGREIYAQRKKARS
jgi:hypothetical protein